jgi:hypothetical protein
MVRKKQNFKENEIIVKQKNEIGLDNQLASSQSTSVCLIILNKK